MPAIHHYARVLSIAAILVVAAHAHAQTLADSATLAGQLQKAADQAHQLATQLPSFTCTETGTSELLHDGKLKKQVPFTAAIRGIRSPGGYVREEQTILTVNGKPAGKHPNMPFNVHEAFTDVLSYVDAREQSCFAYKPTPSTATTTRIDFQSTGTYIPACANLPGTTGFFLLDSTDQVIHMERTVPPSLGSEGDIVPYAAVDLAPVDLGGKTYMLAAHLLSTREDDKDLHRLDATFTNCKLFKAEITIHGGTNETTPPPE